MSNDRRPHADITIDAVQRLNPDWQCWRFEVPAYYAQHPEYGEVDATDPEDLHIAILRAEGVAGHERGHVT